MRVDILGVGVDDVSLPQAVAKVKRRMENGHQTVVYTPNPIIIDRARTDGKLRQTLNRAHISLPDGVGVLLAAKLLSRPLSNRVAGIEFGQAILHLAARHRLRVFLLGGKPNVAKAAARRLTQKYPSLTVCGTHHGYFDEKHSPAIVQAIMNAQTDILFVCLGSPRQEFWIAAHLPPTVKLAAALGGSLDVWAGNVKRAPKAVSAIGLEWLWRMTLEPKRTKGLLPILRFLAASAKQRGKELF